MKISVSEKGELCVSYFILPLLSLAIGLAVLVGLVDVGAVWAFHHDGIRWADVGASDLWPFAAINLIAIVLLVAVLRFVPIEHRCLFARESLVVVERRAFRMSSKSYQFCDIDGFTFRYFLPYHSWFRSARIRMEFGNGEVQELMLLSYISQCKRVHAAMETHFLGVGRGSVVGPLPPD